jgi:hypothetical protein
MDFRNFTLVMVVVGALSFSVSLAGQGTSGQSAGGSAQRGVRDTGSGPQSDTAAASQVQSRQRAQEQDCNLTADQQKSQSREQTRIQERNRIEYPCYETMDGEILQWRHRYTRRMRSYEEKKDEDAMLRYLRRVCEREGIDDPDQIAGFTKWALEQKPWRE